VGPPLEAVPNFSEGRERTTIDALKRALAAHARVLDVHVDADHNRSVFTLAGNAETIADALVAGVACARERIDLRRHEGVHPRVGVADVVPVVAVWPDQIEEAKRTALDVAERIGGGLDLPVFLYGELAPAIRPALLRRGGPAELQRRLDDGELEPDFGPARLDPAAGCVLVGARRPLIAFNVNLATEDLEIAKAIAAVVRESGGGFSGVRALGFPLASRGLVQVSMNIEDWRRAPPPEIVARIDAEAAARGVAVVGSELVGLMPEGAAEGTTAALLRLPALGERQLLEPMLLGDRRR
jgi:glutamate formiminotransferase